MLTIKSVHFSFFLLLLLRLYWHGTPQKPGSIPSPWIEKATCYLIISVRHFIQQVLANYYGETGKIETTGVKPAWPGGGLSPPRDAPECGFENESCQSSESFYLLSYSILNHPFIYQVERRKTECTHNSKQFHLTTFTFYIIGLWYTVPTNGI